MTTIPYLHMALSDHVFRYKYIECMVVKEMRKRFGGDDATPGGGGALAQFERVLAQVCSG